MSNGWDTNVLLRVPLFDGTKKADTSWQDGSQKSQYNKLWMWTHIPCRDRPLIYGRTRDALPEVVVTSCLPQVYYAQNRNSRLWLQGAEGKLWSFDTLNSESSIHANDDSKLRIVRHDVTAGQISFTSRCTMVIFPTNQTFINNTLHAYKAYLQRKCYISVPRRTWLDMVLTFIWLPGGWPFLL